MDVVQEQIEARDASTLISDTFDLLHIAITLEVIDFGMKHINGFTEIIKMNEQERPMAGSCPARALERSLNTLAFLAIRMKAMF